MFRCGLLRKYACKCYGMLCKLPLDGKIIQIRETRSPSYCDTKSRTSVLLSYLIEINIKILMLKPEVLPFCPWRQRTDTTPFYTKLNLN